MQTGRDEGDAGRYADHLRVHRLWNRLLRHHLWRLLSHRLSHVEPRRGGRAIRSYVIVAVDGWFHRRIDAIVYFWIFVSLMDTMDTLVEKKQERKLQIYKKLRLLLIVSVILATVTLVGFSYIVLNDLSSHMWKYQWL